MLWRDKCTTDTSFQPPTLQIRLPQSVAGLETVNIQSRRSTISSWKVISLPFRSFASFHFSCKCAAATIVHWSVTLHKCYLWFHSFVLVSFFSSVHLNECPFWVGRLKSVFMVCPTSGLCRLDFDMCFLVVFLFWNQSKLG